MLLVCVVYWKITIFHSIPFRSEFLLLLQRVVSGLSSSLHVYYILTFCYSSSSCILCSSLASSVVYYSLFFALFLLTNAELNAQKLLNLFYFLSFHILHFAIFHNKLHCCFCGSVYFMRIFIKLQDINNAHYNNVLLCFFDVARKLREKTEIFFVIRFTVFLKCKIKNKNCSEKA